MSVPSGRQAATWRRLHRYLPEMNSVRAQPERSPSPLQRQAIPTMLPERTLPPPKPFWRAFQLALQSWQDRVRENEARRV